MKNRPLTTGDPREAGAEPTQATTHFRVNAESTPAGKVQNSESAFTEAGRPAPFGHAHPLGFIVLG